MVTGGAANAKVHTHTHNFPLIAAARVAFFCLDDLKIN
jgi:hypothetical protein